MSASRHQDVPTAPRVTFVVVNWNQQSLTLDCLQSLMGQNYPSFSIVLVDNGSNDGSVNAIRAAYPTVTLIANDDNLGIAAANNIGIKHALANGADYVFLLNNDTIVDEQMLSQLIVVAESDSTVGIVGPTMYYFDPPDRIWCAGNSIDWRNGGTHLLYNGQTDNDLDQSHVYRVDYIASCAACIKRAVFDEIGLMDERFFIYYDETDWFVRATQMNWQVLHVPWAKLWHRVSATMGESSPITDYYMVRNNLLFLSKHRRGRLRWAALAMASFEQVRAVIAYTVRSHNGERTGNRNAKTYALCDAALGRWGMITPSLHARLTRT